QVYETSDGRITVAFVGGAKDQWPLFCALLDRVDLIDDERFQNSWSRTQHYDELNPMIVEGMRKKTTGQWLEELSEAGIPCGPVNDIIQVSQDPQVRARDMITEVPHPKGGRVKVINTPIKLSRTPALVKDPAPGHGAHTRAVLEELLGLDCDDTGPSS
ncbi:MAG: CoA transferase, partial [Dehalococcoidia bacterium]